MWLSLQTPPDSHPQLSSPSFPKAETEPPLPARWERPGDRIWASRAPKVPSLSPSPARSSLSIYGNVWIGASLAGCPAFPGQDLGSLS